MHSSHVQYQPRLVSNVSIAAPIPAAPPIPHERVLGHRRPAPAPDSSVRELNVSGVRVLLALGGTIGLAALLLWGVVRDWLFAQ